MAKILKNTTISSISLADAGVSIPASPGTYTIPPQEFFLFAGSVDIDAHIASGAIIVNDGYDDLKPQNGLLHIHEESIPRQSAYLATASVLVTANSTLTLTASSRLLYMFTGSIAGQILKLPDATTLQVGHKYEVWNTSTASINITYSNNASVFVVAASQKTWAVLQNNSTAVGTWLIEANYQGGTGGGNGCLNFGYNGTANTNRWLEVIGNNPSNGTPFVVAGSKAIKSFSIGADINSTSTVALFKNGVSVDSISLTGIKKLTKLNLNILLADGDTLSAQVTSGTISRPIFTLWL